MTLLLLSLAALAAGPLLHRVARANPPAMAALDGFNFIAIGGLALLHGIPDSFRHAGWAALGAALFGLVGPTLLERRIHRAAHQAHSAAAYLVVAGLGLHAMVDGAVIASSSALALAVVLHRLPVSLTIWMLLLPQYRLAVRAAVLCVLAIMTGVGYGMSGLLLHDATYGLGLFQALVSGSLLHVLIHRPATRATAYAGAAGWGAFGGLVLLWFAHGLPSPHAHTATSTSQIDTAEAFVRLAAESAPALLLAYLGAGLIEVFLPRATVRWMGQGSTLSQALRGVSFGLPLPICSCGVIPLYRSLIVRGTPAAAAIAFLVATPEIGVDAVLLSIPLLGIELTVVRLGCAALVAIAVGWLIGRLDSPRSELAADDDQVQHTASSLTERLKLALRAGFGEVVDNTGPWILLGLAVAAVGAGMLRDSWLTRLPSALQIAMLALAGIPTYVCATGATPLVTMLIDSGVSAGAALAFLLTGPATNATTFGVLSRLHGRRTALAFGLAVTVLAAALGLVVDQLIPAPRVFPIAGSADGHAPGPLRLLSLVALGLVFALSLLRQGPRRFTAQIISLETRDESERGGDRGESCQSPHSCG